MMHRAGRSCASRSGAGGDAPLPVIVAFFRCLMVSTGDNVHAVARRRRAVAIEPMSCPPNALRSGTDLLTLAPGQVVQGRWGLVPLWPAA